jgi:hypothetical protein
VEIKLNGELSEVQSVAKTLKSIFEVEKTSRIIVNDDSVNVHVYLTILPKEAET